MIDANKKFMLEAIKEGKKALKNGEVPVGAVIVKDEKIVSRGRNKREEKENALCHAEIMAIDGACRKLKSFRLDGCEMYVSLEPCAMCAGAILNSRLKKVYVALEDKNYGCVKSHLHLLDDPAFERKVESEFGLLKEEAESLINTFFSKIRNKNKIKKMLFKEVTFKKEREIGGIQFGQVEGNFTIKMGKENKVIGIVEDKKGFEVTLILGTEEDIINIEEKLKVYFPESYKIISKVGNEDFFLRNVDKNFKRTNIKV